MSLGLCSQQAEPALTEFAGKVWKFLIPPVQFGFVSNAGEPEVRVDIVIIEWGCLLFQGHKLLTRFFPTCVPGAPIHLICGLGDFFSWKLPPIPWSFGNSDLARWFGYSFLE